MYYLDRILSMFYKVLVLSWYKNISKRIVLNGVPLLIHIDKVLIGDNVAINNRVFINAMGGVEVGNNTIISYGSSIISTGLDRSSIDGHKSQKIKIGAYVWIGANSTILPGVTIADNCTIAAGSVVVKDCIEPNCLYGGVPARKIKEL